MNFGEVLQEIIGTTKRADKLSAIKQAVNSVIGKVVLGTDFRRDLLETTIAISSSEYIQAVDNSLLTNFRKWEYIRPYGYRKVIEKLDGPLAVFTDEGCEKNNCYYVAGNQTILRLQTLSSSLVVGYFQYPNTLVENTDTHWLLDFAPYLVINGACAKVFRDIGDTESSRQHETDYRDTLSIVISDQKYGVNYG